MVTIFILFKILIYSLIYYYIVLYMPTILEESFLWARIALVLTKTNAILVRIDYTP